MTCAIHQALIMAAGRGERLMPLTANTPKPLVPITIDGKCGLDLAIDAIKKNGIQNIVVNAYYLADQICAYIAGKHPDVRVSLETEPLETGGGLVAASSYFDAKKPLLILNSDTYIHNMDQVIMQLCKRFSMFDKNDAQHNMMLAISQIAPLLNQGKTYFGNGDYFYNEHTCQLRHRKEQLHAPYVFIGPRIFGPHYLNANYVLQFQKQGCFFSQTHMFHDAEKHNRLFGHVVGVPWVSISATGDVDDLLKTHMTF